MQQKIIYDCGQHVYYVTYEQKSDLK